MNSGVREQLDQAYAGILFALLIAVALYFLKVVLALVLKRRLNSRLAPGLSEDDAQTFFPRILALIGLNAAPRQTLGSVRLRPTMGLRLVCWGGLLLLVYIHRQMNAPALGPETLITGLVFINALHVELYEVEYDRADVMLPRWWFGRSVHRWRDLVEVTARDPWMMTMHFSDDRRVKVHKYIVGHAEFMAVAKAAVRNI